MTGSPSLFGWYGRAGPGRAVWSGTGAALQNSVQVPLRDTLSKLGALLAPTLLGVGPAEGAFDANGVPTEEGVRRIARYTSPAPWASSGVHYFRALEWRSVGSYRAAFFPQGVRRADVEPLNVFVRVSDPGACGCDDAAVRRRSGRSLIPPPLPSDEQSTRLF